MRICPRIESYGEVWGWRNIIVSCFDHLEAQGVVAAVTSEKAVNKDKIIFTEETSLSTKPTHNAKKSKITRQINS